MTKTHVTLARKLATGTLAGLVAGMLMFPSMALAIDSGTIDGNEITNGTEAEGEGSGGGTWAYDGADTITLNDFIGETIQTVGDTIINANGTNEVTSIEASGDLTINGDENAAGEAKPTIAVKGAEQGPGGTSVGGISAYNKNADGEYASLEINDMNIKMEAESSSIFAANNLTINNSKVARGENNKSLSIQNAQTSGNVEEQGTVTIKDSVIEATAISSTGNLVFEYSDVDVVPREGIEKSADWVKTAVMAFGKITMKNMKENYEIVTGNTGNNGREYQYVTTGSDDKVELRAAGTPGYYGVGTKGMPATSDTTMPLVITLSIATLCAAGMAVYSRKDAYAGKHVK